MIVAKAGYQCFFACPLRLIVIARVSSMYSLSSCTAAVL
jgi:hypothetical protein